MCTSAVAETFAFAAPMLHHCRNLLFTFLEAFYSRTQGSQQNVKAFISLLSLRPWCVHSVKKLVFNNAGLMAINSLSFLFFLSMYMYMYV